MPGWKMLGAPNLLIIWLSDKSISITSLMLLPALGRRTVI
ncbi:Uncharacterised protein [Segatella copri]|nr:Uncharacterised protein [Segatella copri]